MALAMRAIRGGNRGKITRLERDATILMREYGTEGSMTAEEVVLKLTTISKTIQEKQICLNQLNQDILNKCRIAEVEAGVDESTDVGTRITEITKRIEDFKKNIGNSEAEGETQLQDEKTISPQRTPSYRAAMPTRSPMGSGLNISSSSSSGQGVKLPKIKLFKFRGEITKFQAFWQSFKIAVPENQSLSKVHKLNYLITALEGAAYKALEGLQMIEENYDKAIELLKARFEKSQQIVSAHMQELLNLQSSKEQSICVQFMTTSGYMLEVWKAWGFLQICMEAFSFLSLCRVCQLK